MTSPSMVALGLAGATIVVLGLAGAPIGGSCLALLPSKQFACMAELVSTVIARRVVDKLDCKGGFRRSNLLEKGNPS